LAIFAIFPLFLIAAHPFFFPSPFLFSRIPNSNRFDHVAVIALRVLQKEHLSHY